MHFSVVKNISPESCYLTFGSFFCLTIGKETLLLHSRLLTHECGVEADDFYFIYFLPRFYSRVSSPPLWLTVVTQLTTRSALAALLIPEATRPVQ